MQPKFLITLFRELKKRNIHTAIDTSGMVDLTDEIKELLTLTDLVLLDIKHINDEKSKTLVGFSNKKELEFNTNINSYQDIQINWTKQEMYIYDIEAGFFYIIDINNYLNL